MEAKADPSGGSAPVELVAFFNTWLDVEEAIDLSKGRIHGVS